MGQDILWILLIACLAVPVSVAITVRHAIRTMLSSPEAREKPSAAAELIRSVPEEFKLLLESEGFSFDKAYSFHATTFGIWTRLNPAPPRRSFSLAVNSGRRVCEFFTGFSDDVSLTTTTTRSAFVFPRPFGSFMQSFPKARADALWRAHLEGEKYLISTLAIVVEECRLPFLEHLKRYLIRNLSHVTSLRLWLIRVMYCYLIKRFLLHNQPLSQQKISELYRKTTV